MKRIIVQQKFEFDEAEFEILKDAMFTTYQTNFDEQKREQGMKLLREMENINV